jgi:hypothetical protein
MVSRRVQELTDMLERAHKELREVKSSLYQAEEKAQSAEFLRRENERFKVEIQRRSTAVDKLQEDFFKARSSRILSAATLVLSGALAAEERVAFQNCDACHWPTLTRKCDVMQGGSKQSSELEQLKSQLWELTRNLEEAQRAEASVRREYQRLIDTGVTRKEDYDAMVRELAIETKKRKNAEAEAERLQRMLDLRPKRGDAHAPGEAVSALDDPSMLEVDAMAKEVEKVCNLTCLLLHHNHACTSSYCLVSAASRCI